MICQEEGKREPKTRTQKNNYKREIRRQLTTSLARIFRTCGLLSWTTVWLRQGWILFTLSSSLVFLLISILFFFIFCLSFPFKSCNKKSDIFYKGKWSMPGPAVPSCRTKWNRTKVKKEKYSAGHKKKYASIDFSHLPPVWREMTGGNNLVASLSWVMLRSRSHESKKFGPYRRDFRCWMS